jgi:hypothetical protein
VLGLVKSSIVSYIGSYLGLDLVLNKELILSKELVLNLGLNFLSIFFIIGY